MFAYLLGFGSLIALMLASFWMAANDLSGGMILAMDGGILIAFCFVDWLLSADRSMPTPTRVYAMLLIMLTAGGAVVYALSFLGPLVIWLTIVLMIATVVLTVIRKPHTREAREAAGLCPDCGYDLRATEARCPECNALVPESILRFRRLSRREKDLAVKAPVSE